ncbi:SnoaL-like protein [Tahibacter aquaticus]|uniref:SnoaL-like protein n=1 Tax=Tahibacter aquaticus TaxID=520092 RepID=A0A4R6YT87_9GAMM|nr:nuclear transport factor 2 family protein [Tahibacter aquaticus]TDR41541.1 SnoaL-like protein [Tahibacter aquaticus]
MYQPLRRISAVCAVVLACTAAAQASAANTAEAAIRQVVRQFQEGIRAKDGAALRSLFLAKDNSWLRVATTAEWQYLRSRRADAAKVEAGSYENFVREIVDDSESVEERFSNIHIHTNGTVASVHFDFVFIAGERTTNQGQEAWHLVNTEQGWKISSVIYSAERPAQR